VHVQFRRMRELVDTGISDFTNQRELNI